MARYSGKGGVCYMSATLAGAAVQVARLNEWALTTAAATSDVTVFSDENMQYVQHIPDCVAQISGVWDDTDDALWDNSESTTGVNVYLYPSDQVMTKYWYGPAWFSVNDVTVSVAAGVVTSGTISAAGAWGQY